MEIVVGIFIVIVFWAFASARHSAREEEERRNYNLELDRQDRIYVESFNKEATDILNSHIESTHKMTAINTVISSALQELAAINDDWPVSKAELKAVMSKAIYLDFRKCASSYEVSGNKFRHISKPKPPVDNSSSTETIKTHGSNYSFADINPQVELVFGKAQNEAYYQEVYARSIGGQTEVRTALGTRIDILTDTHACEVDFDEKWAEAIGQAQHYASETGLKPMIVLIIKDNMGNRDHFKERLESTIIERGLPIDVKYIYANNYPMRY